MSKLSLTPAQAALITSTTSKLEDAFADGVETATTPVATPLLPKMEYYKDRLKADQKKAVKDTFKSIFSAFVKTMNFSGAGIGTPETPLSFTNANITVAGGLIIDASNGSGSGGGSSLHAQSHEVGGSDVIPHQSLLGAGTYNHADIDTHINAASPHSGHELTSNKNAANGYAGLTASKLNGAQQVYGILVNTACEGNDARLSDTRVPIDYYSVKDTVYAGGAKGDGVTNDHAAIAAAIAAAQSQYNTTGFIGTVYFPRGTYLTNTALSITASPVNFVGAGLRGVTIKAGAAMTAIFNFADIAQNTYFSFSDMILNANGNADYCIKSSKLDHGIFQRLYLTGSKVCALSIGYGWCNDILECEIVYNANDGIRLTDNSNNAVNIKNTKVFANDGIGINILGGGLGISIHGCTIESNKICGVYAVGCNGFNYIGNYHEGNATTGYAFTLPAARTVHSDIILNGSATPTTRGSAYPVSGAVIEGCWFSGPVSSTGCITLGGVSGLTVANNAFYAASALDILGCTLLGDGSCGVTGLKMYGNTGEGKSVGFVDFTTNVAPSVGHDWDIDKVSKKNYFHHDVLANVTISSNANPAVPAKSATNRNNEDVWEFPAVAGTTDVYGKVISVTDHPELANQWVCLSAEVKIGGSAATQAVVLAAIGIGLSTDGYFASNAWITVSFVFKMPASGTVGVGFLKIGGNNIISVYRPLLTLVGAKRDDFFRAIDGPNYIRREATAAPTVGTWAVGSSVWNSVPATGQPVGWSCSVAGTPGTWVSMGNYA
jgi:hypothetical protein